VVTSPLANTELSHSNVQSTKHEHTNPVYLCSPYQTRVVCIDLARFSLAWLQILTGKHPHSESQEADHPIVNS
jgi:hypothetical protein